MQKLKLNWPSRFERSVLLITHRKDCTWCNYRRKTQYFTLQYLVCLIFQFSVAWSRTWPNVPSPPWVWCVTLSVALQPCFFFFRSSLLQSHLFAPLFKTYFCCDILTVLFMQAIIYWWWSIVTRNMLSFQTWLSKGQYQCQHKFYQDTDTHTWNRTMLLDIPKLSFSSPHMWTLHDRYKYVQNDGGGD